MNIQKRFVNGGAPTLPLIPPPVQVQPMGQSGPMRVRMTVTPQQAQEWLTRNPDNRNIREGHVLRLAQDLEAGRWRYNGDVIRITPEGNVWDGQHRLSACVLAGAPMDTDVIFNLPETVCDIGAARSASDMATKRKIKNAGRVTTLAKWVLIDRKHGISKVNSSSLHPSKTEIIEEVERNNEALQEAIVFSFGKMASPIVVDFCNYRFRQTHPELAHRFMAEAATGASADEGSAATLLHMRLITNYTSKAKLDSRYLVALFFVAWKYYREGKPLRSLKWSEGQEFPQI